MFQPMQAISGSGILVMDICQGAGVAVACAAKL
jgi:hypothetical protein